jgi:hypothetical protein
MNTGGNRQGCRAVYEDMNARRLLILLPLLLAACGDAHLALRSVPLTGSPAEIRELEGAWYDGDGKVAALITGGSAPTLNVRGFPKEYAPRSASVEGQDLLLHLPLEPGCRCERSPRFNLPALGLLRNPPASWIVERVAWRTARFARKAAARTYDRALDELARRL